MNVKECIDKMKNLVDNIIIQYDDYEVEIPIEDAEFLDEIMMEHSVAAFTRLPSADYCIIYLD
jgi:hypothetical protein